MTVDRRWITGWLGATLTLLACSGPTEAQAPRWDGFEPCDGARAPAFCGSVTVPEDHDDPGSRRIDLRVKVLAGSDRSEPPIFFLAGGPGQAAADLEGLVVQRLGTRLPDREFVLIDQRGTGGSNPLSCTSGVPSDPTRLLGPHYTEEELDACLLDLSERADVRLYTTTQFARDLDAVRDTLGYDRVDVVGGSYGTKAGLVYMRLFPATIRSAVLEGVAPPSFLNPLPHARGSQDAIEKLFAACAADARCDAAYPDLGPRFERLLARLRDEPARVPAPGTDETVPLEWGMMAFLTHVLMFNAASASAVPALITSVEAGDYRLITSIAQQINTHLVGGIYFGLQSAVTCTENAPVLATMDVEAVTAGTYLGTSMVNGVVEQCVGWPRGTVPAGFYDPVTVSVPTLILVGGLDPATPPGFGQEVAGQLGDARLVRVEEAAHVLASPCVDGIVSRFLTAGSHRDLDTSCTAEVRRPPFQVQP